MFFGLTRMTVSFSRQIHNNVYGGLFANPNPSWLKKRPFNTKTHVKDWSTIYSCILYFMYRFIVHLLRKLIWSFELLTVVSHGVFLTQSLGGFQRNLAKDLCSHWFKCRYILWGEIILKYLTIRRLKSPFSPDVNQMSGWSCFILFKWSLTYHSRGKL